MLVTQKKTNYDKKLRNITNRVTSNETNQTIKLDEHVSSYTKLINDLPKKLSQVLTKDNKLFHWQKLLW